MEFLPKKKKMQISVKQKASLQGQWNDQSRHTTVSFTAKVMSLVILCKRRKGRLKFNCLHKQSFSPLQVPFVLLNIFQRSLQPALVCKQEFPCSPHLHTGTRARRNSPGSCSDSYSEVKIILPREVLLWDLNINHCGYYGLSRILSRSGEPACLACSGVSTANEEVLWWRVEHLAVTSSSWHLFAIAGKDTAQQLRGQISPEVQVGKRGSHKIILWDQPQNAGFCP